MPRQSPGVRRSVSLVCAFALIAVLCSPGPGLAQGDKKTKSFVRLQKDNKGNPIAFQTATGKYADAKGDVKIHLIGVVHIGERKYYEKYNEIFKDYDVVLYEAVGGPIKTKPNPLDNLEPLAMFYGYLSSNMKVTEQMKVIDYTPKNMVHADVRGEDFPAIMNRRGDNLLSLFLTIVADIIRENNLAAAKMKAQGKKPAPFDPFSLFRAPEGSYKLRLGMAKQLAESEATVGLGKTVDSLLLDERNAVCIKVLEKQIKAGKKKIAIFYGAAHMPDFERRLVKDFNMQAQGMDWYTAWEIVDPKMEKKKN